MKALTAKDFKVGMRVRWESNPEDRGTVIEVGYCRVKVRWDVTDDPDCQIGVYGEAGFPLWSGPALALLQHQGP